MKKLFLLSFLLVSFIAIISCSKDESPVKPTPWTDDIITYDVVYTEKTKIIEEDEISKIISRDENYEVIRFQSSFEKAKNLKPGDILLISCEALRKVSNVNVQASEIVVSTVDCNLNEAIESGRIAWDVGCEFSPSMSPTIQFDGKDYHPKMLNNGNLEWELEYGAYKYKITMEAQTDKLKLKMSVEKKLANSIKGKFEAEGTIERFRSKCEIDYDNSQLSNFLMENDNLKGDLKLSLTVTASGTDNSNIELPIVFFKFPFLVGKIPVVISVKAQLVINSVVPLDGSSMVSAKFKYNSATGFSYDGHNVQLKGNVGPYSITKDVAQTGASGAIGVNFGIGFPRLEFAIFNQVIVPWIQTAFLISGDFTFTPPCQQARASFIGACGIKFDFLGKKTSLTRTLWQMDKDLLKSGECP